MGPVGLLFANVKSGEVRAGVTRARVINSSEVFGSQQTDTFRETRDALPLGADGQFLAAARAPAGEDRTTVLGLHAAAKTMRLGAVAIVRLKSTFRHFSSSI